MARIEDNVTVVACEIVGASRLYATIGENRAKQKISQALRSMNTISVAHQGANILSRGAELICAFESAESACLAAIGMHLELNSLHFYLHSGIACGRMLVDADDVHGEAIEHATQLTHQAQANQILLEEKSYTRCGALQNDCSFLQHHSFAHEATSCNVYLLHWNVNPQTPPYPSSKQTPTPLSGLR